MPLQATSGAASYDAFGGGVPVAVNYIEEVFSTFLYTGNNSTLSINNSIDLSTKGGLVWIKNRQQAAYYHTLVDTVRGPSNQIYSNATDAQYTATGLDVTAFTSTGFTLGPDNFCNQNNGNNVSWTFREQPKFFDIVTYTGNGTNNRAISHNLGSTPGTVIVKCTSAVAAWPVWHRSLAGSNYNMYLNLTTASGAQGDFSSDGSASITSTTFPVSNGGLANTNAATYVAYVFAHDAGGFGLTGTDNVISCGSFTLDGSGNATVNLGYEPQWVMYKRTTATSDWFMVDTMRGFVAEPGTDNLLSANTAAAEDVGGGSFYLTSTGFKYPSGTPSNTWIYIAIRRGPMKVPTVGTSVFSPIAYTGNSTSNTTVQNLTTNFSGDATIIQQRDGGNNPLVFDKLRGSILGLYTSLTLAEEDINAFRAGQSVGFNNTQTVLTGQFTAQGNYNYSGNTFVSWNFKRAPSFMDVVCYTGDGTAGRTITHNLGVAPELMLIKCRSTAHRWLVIKGTDSLNLSTTDAASSVGSAFATTSTYFTVSNGTNNNASGLTYVNYLFATCAGVSKVGSYTGNGTTQTIDCGFGAGGARFVLIKRTDSTGAWYVYDTARGMTVLTDPYLLLNSTAAESATLGSVTTVSTGFALNSTILAAINVSAGSYIFLAIA